MSLYFPSMTQVDRFSSGCTPLDCVLGGGWARGKVINVVGDKSTGKTLLAIEATANFVRETGGEAFYCEVESSFDTTYAEAVGLPLSNVTFPKKNVLTVENFYESIVAYANSVSKPGLFILDSLDALSDKSEQERNIEDGTFGARKAKLVSEIFRRIVARLSNKDITLMIVSQIRDNMSSGFGSKHSRSGGRALDFYSSQTIWLRHMKILNRTSKGVSLPYGVLIEAKCTKNKTGMPFRKCLFPIHFLFGVEDVLACAEWLSSAKIKEVDGLDLKTLTPKKLNSMNDEDYEEIHKKLGKKVSERWQEIEEGVAPRRSKYRKTKKARKKVKVKRKKVGDGGS